MLSKSLVSSKKRPIFLSIYNPNDYIPKTSLYSLFFKQNQRQFPKKLLQSVVTSYLGGVVFGGMMLGLTLINNIGLGGMDFLNESSEQNYKFKSTAEFLENCKYQLRSLHHNGTFVIKYTLFMGLVNFASIYFPTLNSSFEDLYGFKSLHFLFNCVLPTSIYLNFAKTPLKRRLFYTLVFPTTYYLSSKAKKRLQGYLRERQRLQPNELPL